MKKKLLISACLLGTPCRYDGRSKPCPQIEALSERFDFVPICPEVLGGLSTPRLPCEISMGRVIRKDGEDLTDFYQKGAEIALQTAKENLCSTALLKEKSPSCGPHFRYDGTFSGALTEEMGLTAHLLSENGIRVFSEDEIHLI